MTNCTASRHGLSIQRQFSLVPCVAHLYLDQQVHECSSMAARMCFRCWPSGDPSQQRVRQRHWVARRIKRQVLLEILHD